MFGLLVAFSQLKVTRPVISDVDFYNFYITWTSFLDCNVNPYTYNIWNIPFKVHKFILLLQFLPNIISIQRTAPPPPHSPHRRSTEKGEFLQKWRFHCSITRPLNQCVNKCVFLRDAKAQKKPQNCNWIRAHVPTPGREVKLAPEMKSDRQHSENIHSITDSQSVRLLV